jgi:hypothetical protein
MRAARVANIRLAPHRLGPGGHASGRMSCDGAPPRVAAGATERERHFQPASAVVGHDGDDDGERIRLVGFDFARACWASVFDPLASHVSSNKLRRHSLDTTTPVNASRAAREPLSWRNRAEPELSHEIMMFDI